MRSLDGEPVASVTVDPEKTYSFTWPGQRPRTVKGSELAEIVKGADASMLGIQEIVTGKKKETDHG